MGLRSLLLTILAIIAQSSFGQESEPPKLTAHSELVVVPVVVTSGSVPVGGLSAKDFTIKQDGKRVVIASFEAMDTRPLEPVDQPELSPRTAQNFLSVGETRQDLVIVLLDFLNNSWSSGARIRSYLAEMARTLEQTRAPFAVCVVTKKGLVQIQSIGNDPHDFLNAVKAWEHGSLAVDSYVSEVRWAQPFTPVPKPNENIILDRNALKDPPKSAHTVESALDDAVTTAQAFEQIAEAYKGIPGRKKLVWFSIGMPGNFDLADWDGPEAMTSTRIAEKTARAIKALSDANIAVYPVDANVVNPSWEEHFSPAINRKAVNTEPSQFAERPTNVSSLLEFAERTGGNTCTLAPDKCLTNMLNDSNHYYVLGFYLGRAEKKGWHKLDVKVNRPNASVRARSGFLVGDLADQHWVANDMILTALASPLDYTAIPLTLRWDQVTGTGKGSHIELMISSPPHNVWCDPANGKLDVDLLAFVRAAGKTEGSSYPASLVRTLSSDQQRNLAANGFRFHKLVDLSPGRYELRVLVRDNVGRRTVTVSTTITVE